MSIAAEDRIVIPQSEAEFKKAVEFAISDIEKEYGKGAIQRLGQRVGQKVPCIPTGIPSIDNHVLGIGGFARGRVIEIYGPESGGKTTLLLRAIAEAQKAQGLAAFIDAEHAFSPTWAKLNGVDVDSLLVAQPDYGEQALEITERLIRSGAFAIIGVDSVAALVPKAELEGDMGDSVVYETPVYIRTIGSPMVNIVQIGDLHCKNQTGWYKKHKRLEILTHKGWAKLLGVQKKKNTKNKAITYTRTGTGYIGTTNDHSLFVDGKEASPAELKVFDRLDVYKSTVEFGEYKFISHDISWLLGLYVAEGSTPRTSACNSFEVCGTDKALMERCQSIVKNTFGIAGEVRIANEAEGNRKTLYVYNAPANDALASLMHPCISTGKSRVKQIPEFILNSTKETQTSFIDGFWAGDGNHSAIGKPRRFYNNSWVVIAGIQNLLMRQGIRTNTVTNKTQVNELTLYENSGRLVRKENEIIQFYEGAAPEFLYDICTEHGTFVSAIGNIICHNSHMGLQARLMSQALRKLTGIVSKSNTCLIFINQIREKIGVMFGSPETTTGGRALKFYSSVRLDVRRIAQIKDGDEIIGGKIRIRGAKNKLDSPFKEAEVDLLFDRGFDPVGNVLDVAVEHGIVAKAGSWFSYKTERIGQGRANTVQFLIDNPAIYDRIYTELNGVG